MIIVKIVLIGFGILVVLGALMTLPEAFQMVSSWRRLFRSRTLFIQALKLAGINVRKSEILCTANNAVVFTIKSLTEEQTGILEEYGCDIDVRLDPNRKQHPGDLCDEDFVLEITWDLIERVYRKDHGIENPPEWVVPKLDLS